MRLFRSSNRQFLEASPAGRRQLPRWPGVAVALVASSLAAVPSVQAQNGTCPPPCAPTLNGRCQIPCAPGLKPRGGIISDFFGRQQGRPLGEQGLNECTLDLVYGDEREKNFQLRFANGLVRRQGSPYTSSYYTWTGTSTQNPGWKHLSWEQKAEIFFSSTPVGFPQTVYAVDLEKRFYAVDIYETVDLRSLIDKQPSRPDLAKANCEEKGYSGDLQNLQVVHSAILGLTVDQVAATSYRAKGVTRVMLVSGNVLGAGIILVNNGKVALIGNCSGHYRPPLETLDANVQQLQQANVTAGPLVDGVYYNIPELGCAIAFFTTDGPSNAALYNLAKAKNRPETPGQRN